MNLARVQVKANGTSKSVVVNDRDISDVVAELYLDIKPGEVPRIGVSFNTPDIELEGDGIVQVNVYPDVDPREFILAFLESVDPDAMEARSLEGADMATPVGVSFINALKELIK